MRPTFPPQSAVGNELGHDGSLPVAAQSSLLEFGVGCFQVIGDDYHQNVGIGIALQSPFNPADDVSVLEGVLELQLVDREGDFEVAGCLVHRIDETANI